MINIQIQMNYFENNENTLCLMCMFIVGLLLWLWVSKRQEFFRGQVIPSLIDPSDNFLYDKYRLDHWTEWAQCKQCMKKKN